MNIFVLDTNPETAAQMQCDKHIPKMILECAQMMVSALRRYGVTDEYLVDKGVVTKTGTPYKETHKNHPCTRWAGDSRDNFKWLARHAQALLTEYSNRFDKVHACNGPVHIMSCKDHIIPEGGLTQFALAMPDEYRPEPIDGETVYHAYPKFAIKAYQKYYHSKTFAKWEKGRPAPDWWKGLTGTVI